jgi:phosphatidylglycerophosphate synthase
MYMNSSMKQTTSPRRAVVLALDPEYRTTVFGVPVLQRTVLILLRAGIEEIEVVTWDDPQNVSGLLKKGVEAVRVVQVNAHKDAETFDDVLADSTEKEPVLVVWGHSVLDASSVQAMLALPHALPFGVTADLSNQAAEHAMYILPASEAQVLVEQTAWGQTHPLSLLSRVLLYPAPGPLPFSVGKRNEDTVLAEYVLTRQLKKETNSSDGFMARHFDRHISMAMSSRLATTTISPNLITLCGTAIGLLGAWLLSSPLYWVQVTGAALFLFCIIVDGVDGEVARLKLKQSTFGHYLDIITDNLVHVAVFIGMAVGLGARFGREPYLWGLLVLLVGFGLCAPVVYYCFRLNDQERLHSGSLAMKLVGLLANRDFAYLVFILAVVDRLKWFFWGSAVGSVLLAVLLYTLARREAKPESG